MLEGQPFTFYTEHKPLAYALGKVADGWTAMQCQQLSIVVEFTTDIGHVPGVDNVVADTLYRPPSHTTEPDSCSHTAGPGSCFHAARAVSAVSPIAELLDYASIAKNQLICLLTKKLRPLLPCGLCMLTCMVNSCSATCPELPTSCLIRGHLAHVA